MCPTTPSKPAADDANRAPPRLGPCHPKLSPHCQQCHPAERPDFTVYNAFFDLLPRCREAHQAGDTETLRRVYGFAEWCFAQKAKDLWNAAGVAFYEHLFDSHRSLWPEYVRWLSPQVVEGCWGLWEWRLTAEELAEVRRLLAECRKPLYPEARGRTRRCT